MIVTCAGDPITVSNNFDRLVIVTCAGDPITVLVTALTDW